MENLKELIGKEVMYYTEDECIKCKVINVSINDYYFEEKNEPIYIELQLEPLKHKSLYEYEDFNNVSLSDIRLN